MQKFTEFSITKKIEKQRQLMGSSGGRDDPANVLGFQHLRPLHRTQGGGLKPVHGRNRTATGQLEPLKDRRTVNTVGIESVQKSIYGMLSDQNRANTMRIATLVLKEQKQQLRQ